MPGTSQGIFCFLITVGRTIGLGTSNLGESWSVVMRLIMRVIERLARTTALLVLLEKIKSVDVMVEDSFGSGNSEIIEF